MRFDDSRSAFNFMRKVAEPLYIFLEHHRCQPRQVLFSALGQVVQQLEQRRLITVNQLPEVTEIKQCALRRFKRQHDRHRSGWLRQRQTFGQRFEAGGLEQAVIHAGVEAVGSFIRLGIGGKPDDQAAWCSTYLLFGPDRLGQGIAVHDRHAAVGDHHVETTRSPGAQAMRTVFGFGNVVPQIAQLFGEQQAIGWVVVHYQNVQHALFQACG